MKPNLEKNIFIKRIIDYTQCLNPKIISKSKNTKELKENNLSINKSKNYYIKPHPIFIISNTFKKNQFYLDTNLQKDENNIFIKSNNTERHKYLDIKRKIETNFKEKEINEDLNNMRCKSYEIASFEHISKIKKYFNDKYKKIKIKYNRNNLNTYNKSQEMRKEKYISDNNYSRNKNISLDILDKANKIKLKSSKSKDIIKLCKILKSFEYSKENSDKGTLIKEEDSKGGIISLNKDSLEKKKYLANLLKIILMQKIFRGYIFRKKFKKFCKPDILGKIILIQNFWKNQYLKNNNQISLNFSFKKDEEDNNSSNKDIIYIENINNIKKNCFQRSKLLIKPCFITKILYREYNSIIRKITKIQKYIIKYLSLKQNKNFCKFNSIHNIYKKKNLKKIKQNSIIKKYTINSNKINKIQNNNYNSKSLILVSPEKEFQEFCFNTPKKEKNNRYKFEDVINNNNDNNKKEEEIILNKQIIEFCYISKERKNINLVQKIKYLQKYIIKNRKKRLFIHGVLKNINNICFIDKSNRNYLINDNLKSKIIYLQIHIKRFLKINKYIINNEFTSSELIQKTNKKYKDISSIDKFQSTNEISDKKREDILLNNDINISEFSLNEKINQKENDNLIISNNLTTFSFDFNKIKNENIEDEDCNINTNDNFDNINIINNFSSKNMLISSEKNYFYKKLKSFFVTSITNKFAYFLINIMNKLLLYNFVKILIQKINKYINQYVFFSIFKNKNEKNEIIFFNILRRHLKYNIKYIDNNNEIRNLLIDNIPKVFHNFDENIINFPFINKIQENNLVNIQLFINNDEEMINYFNNFYNKDKGYFSLNNKLLKKILDKYSLKNRNIFTLTNYFDNIYESIINNKLCKKCLCLKYDCNCDNVNKISSYNYIKKKCNYIKMINSKRLVKEKENINNEFFKMIDEEDDINLDEINENEDLNFNKTLNKSNTIKSGIKNYSNLNTFHNINSGKKHEYKFFDYINEKYKNKKYNETLPITHRTNKNSFINTVN